MTPKEKAQELFDKMNDWIPANDSKNIDRFIARDVRSTKQCALIAVDEILKLNHPFVIIHSEQKDGEISDMTQEYFWQEVKQEIEKL